MMRIEQLEYFLEIARTGSINKAAENLFLTQPGLSSAVKSMEKELGTTLLIRTSSGINLTKDGQIIAENASAVLEAYHKMLGKLSTHADPNDTHLEGSLSLTASPVFFSSILIDAVNAFTSRYPHVKINASESDEGHILGMVHHQAFDLGFLSPTDASLARDTHHDLTWVKLFTDEVVAAVSSTSALASRQFLTYQDLHKERVSTFLTNPSMPKANSNFYAISNNVATHIALVSSGQAICVFPRFLSRIFSMAAKNISILPFAPTLDITFYMIMSTNHKCTAAETAFIHFLGDFLLEQFQFETVFHSRP